MNEFVHLHVHSQFSMLDGAIKVPQLVQSVKDHGMPAVALTDHGNMYGALGFYNSCNKAGIKPILGCEVYLVDNHKEEGKVPPRHFVLLAASQEGYRNLVKVVSLGWVEGMQSGTPCVDLELINQHRKGLVGMTACMGGALAQEILLHGEAAGRKALGAMKDCFEPGHLFVELQRHGFIEQGPLNKILVDLAGDVGVKLVATNDCHFHGQGDSRAQLALQCIAAGHSLDDGTALHHGSDQMYLASPGEMIERFKDLPEAIASTLEIAEMCGGAAKPVADPMLPKFPLPDGVDEETQFRRLAKDGLERRFREFKERDISVDEDAYRERLELECDVISKMGFPGYFLIVQDFINWAKERGIPVGPGRGSGAGSIVAYSFRITDLDPIPLGLLFERFLNPERVSMPDFDIDFCMDRREEVIEYVREAYGDTSVGQIATFQMLKSKSVLRDAGRVMGFAPSESGLISSLIPDKGQGQTYTIEEAMAVEPRLKDMYNTDSRVRGLIDIAQNLEGLTRHAGMHAAGLVISDGPLWDHVPVFCPEPGMYVTQFDKNDVEYAGLVKFDFLGLKTLTVIDIACQLIGKRPDRDGTKLAIDRIPMGDPATYALLQSGETTNVFQVESSGMQALFKKLKPDCFEDIVAAVALYRPGPLGSGMVDDFVECKHGRKQVEYPHPCLEEILKPTYGVIVYQEQVMQAAQEMAGYTLGGADLLRRAMGKKKPEEMAKQKDIFLKGSVAKGRTEEDSVKVFELIDYFSGYGFNKSHSAAYALITYQTAYLKAHFPVEFMCATLSIDKDKIDKVVRSVAEARAMGITVLPPDINESQFDFTVLYSDKGEIQDEGLPTSYNGVLRDPHEPQIRFGLGGVRGAGEAVLTEIFAAREKGGIFKHLYDFTFRVEKKGLQKKVLESLIQCGAFDNIHLPMGIERSSAFETVEGALKIGRKLQYNISNPTPRRDKVVEGILAETYDEKKFVETTPWNRRQELALEKKALGFYVSGHPLDTYTREIRRFCSHTVEDLNNLNEEHYVEVAGVVEDFRERKTKAGNRMAFFKLEGTGSSVEVIVRPRNLENSRDVLKSGEPIIVAGKIQMEADRGAPEGEEAKMQAKILMEDAEVFTVFLADRSRCMRINLELREMDEKVMSDLRNTIEANPGNCPVEFELRDEDRLLSLRMMGEELSVLPSESLIGELDSMFGRRVVELV